ncbi:vanillate O-demethylase oxygenase subunit (4-hydroxy-3-methoxybenzoate demethylase) [Alicyclobacillus cellulosilyticus]|uniref:Vanillate O-demethylase oxygenase subunit (4-hydroxy-3-methoxybenzoate demethylase) n=1 Tax=Alicyclobacillus cellulosilyticus TaxID=1003997 RepID=A0A917KI31_9BACL|nr:aromatic ring-hydroxylating dioxygenase subunit alpha [Alicyclobacillus cellulosilyticus]GGJ10655.1 vanillate O-demethylase oxygenase subunit (4-hydroxy-3-methoxybenzoate demethylase) [Alicyclobacillus cellulosilyticus]
MDIQSTTARTAAPRPAHHPLFPRNCTFTPEDWHVLAQFWYPVARADEVTDRPIAVKLLDVELVCYRARGVPVVARDLCVHRGVPLSLGWVEGDEIICPYHGFRYGPDGRCRAIPAAQKTTGISPKLSITVLPAVERYGLIWTSLAAKEENIPPFPEWDDPDYQPILPPTVDIQGSAGRQMEGFLDVAHFAWVHSESFGDRDNPVVPSYKVETQDGWIHAEYLSTVSNYPKAQQHRAPKDFLWLRVYDVYPPFVARLTVHFPYNGRLCIFNAPCPVSARQCRLFSPLARNFDKDQPVSEVHAFNLQIFLEDRAIVEKQKPEELPLDLQQEAHIHADVLSIAYRRRLRELGLGSMYTT